jgi:hypothetical protein
VPVLDPGRGQTKTGYFWAMARDDRPWGGTDPPAVVYTYAPGRGSEHLERLLANYRGIVQCDGYAPYKKLSADRITVAFCWSHLRREFFKVAERGRCAYCYGSGCAHRANLRCREGRSWHQHRCTSRRAPGKIAPAH